MLAALYIFLIIVFSLTLIKSADITVVALRRFAEKAHVKLFGVAAIILAIGTSFPELFVGITSALEENANLSLGVVLGSNIANIALIGGLSALLSGQIRVHGDYFRKDVWISMIAGILPLLLLFDKSLGRVDGLILISVYLAYATSLFKNQYEAVGEHDGESGMFYRFLRKLNHVGIEDGKDLGRLFIGISLMLFSADAVVRFSGMLASNLGIPIFLIGLFILSTGTSLPELAFSLKSLKEHEPSMFFGNILGSIIANSTLIIGLVALIRPITVVALSAFLAATGFFVLIFLLFYLFIRTKHRLDRWEAAILIVLYFTFVLFEIYLGSSY